MQRDKGFGVHPIVPKRVDVLPIARNNRARKKAILLDHADPIVASSLETLLRGEAPHDPKGAGRPAVVMGRAELPGQPHNENDQFFIR